MLCFCGFWVVFVLFCNLFFGGNWDGWDHTVPQREDGWLFFFCFLSGWELYNSSWSVSLRMHADSEFRMETCCWGRIGGGGAS